MTNKIASRPDHGEPLVDEEGKASSNFNLFLDDLFRVANAVFGQSFILNEYTVLQLQTGTTEQILAPAADNENGIVSVTDESGGRTIAKSDGTNWRGADGVIIS